MKFWRAWNLQETRKFCRWNNAGNGTYEQQKSSVEMIDTFYLYTFFIWCYFQDDDGNFRYDTEWIFTTNCLHVTQKQLHKTSHSTYSVFMCCNQNVISWYSRNSDCHYALYLSTIEFLKISMWMRREYTDLFFTVTLIRLNCLTFTNIYIFFCFWFIIPMSFTML